MPKGRKIKLPMNRPLKIIALAVSFFASQAAIADVNPRNGNFAVTYLLSSDHQRITYNSKSTDRGWFGFGWGSVFETRLLVLTDGSAVVLENGTGAQTVYGKKAGKKADNNANAKTSITPEQQLVQQMLNDIIAVDKLDPYQVADLHRELSSPDDRINKLKAYGMSGKVANGTVLQGDGCDAAQLSKVADGYQRIRCESGRDEFDNRGWLVQRTATDGKVFSAIYENAPYPKTLLEPDGSRVDLQWNNRGQLTEQSRTDHEGKPVKVQFNYDQKGNLARMDYFGGNLGGSNNRFRYDDRHNLIEVRYRDETTTLIAYDNADQAIEVTDRQGKQTRYEYSTDSKTREDTTVIVSTNQDRSEQRQILRYTSDGMPTRTHDRQGNWTEYAYHPDLRKVTMVRTAAGERRFGYDPKGQLLLASDTESLRVARFTYDKQGRIFKIVSQDADAPRRVLEFRYNDKNKPVIIKLDGVGQIDVRYDAHGEIETVNSPAGVKIALAVTQAFQSLLSLVKMSGVNFGL
jgi:YD repeat-containing protein